MPDTVIEPHEILAPLPLNSRRPVAAVRIITNVFLKPKNRFFIIKVREYLGCIFFVNSERLRGYGS
jgi:hypothetical protein